MLDIIDEDQLEVKFGGKKPNIEEYWPPVHHTIPKDSIDEEDLSKRRLIPFFIFDEDYENYVKTNIPNEVKIAGRVKSGVVNFKKGRVHLTRWCRGTFGYIGCQIQLGHINQRR